ncbi:unnamed protein product [Prunus armeniaca]
MLRALPSMVLWQRVRATQRPQATVRVILVFGPGQSSWSPRPAQAGFVLWSEFLQLGEIFCPRLDFAVEVLLEILQKAKTALACLLKLKV